MKQTNQTMIGDLRKEFIKLIDAREDEINGRFQENNDKILSSIGTLEGNASNKGEIESL